MFSLVTSYIREKSWFYFVLLVFIVLIGAGLRLIALDEVPGVLHRDETSIGFNAYSIANTGKDEHGVAFPISFQAFGDYKLPGLIYLTSISVSIFGLTETAVRVPTALAAVATLPAVFWLVREMGWSRRVALVSVVLLTLSFWHISQARNVYEPMVGLLLSVMTFSSWLAGKRRKIFWLLTPLLYGAAALTYNVPFLILPVLLTGSALMFYKIENKNLSRNTIFGGASVLASVWILLGVVAALSWGVNASRSNTTVFFHSEIMEWSELATHGFLVNGVPSPLARIVSFPGIDSMIRVMSGYVSAFDPNYLFFVGDQNPWHNLQSISLGNMNPILLFFVVFGVYALWQQRSHIAAQLLALYLFIAPIPNAVTIDAPITNRLLDFHLAVTIIAALGVISLWEKVYESSHNTLVKSIPALLTVAYIAMFAVFLLRYFFVFNPLMLSSPPNMARVF